jgi:hypothetical protein
MLEQYGVTAEAMAQHEEWSRSGTMWKHARYAEWVDNGARFLDKEVPGWWRRVSIETLDMATSRQCVLGQLFGSYSGGCERLGLERNSTTQHLLGFEGYEGEWRSTLWAAQIQYRS